MIDNNTPNKRERSEAQHTSYCRKSIMLGACGVGASFVFTFLLQGKYSRDQGARLSSKSSLCCTIRPIFVVVLTLCAFNSLNYLPPTIFGRCCLLLILLVLVLSLAASAPASACTASSALSRHWFLSALLLRFFLQPAHRDPTGTVRGRV